MQLRSTLVQVAIHVLLLAGLASTCPGCFFAMRCGSLGSGTGHDEMACDDDCTTNLNSDVRHCGSCDHQCIGLPWEEEVACSGGECFFGTRLDSAEGVTALAMDTDSVFWANGCGGAIGMTDKIGGGAELLVSGQYGVVDLAVDGENVYWVIDCQSVHCCLPGVEVAAAALSDGEPVLLAGTDSPSAQSIAIDDSHVYWTTLDRGVWRVEKAGGVPEQLVTEGTFGDIVVRNGAIYVAGFVPSLSSEDSFDIFTLDATDGSLAQLTQGERVQSFDVDGDGALYWIDCVSWQWRVEMLPSGSRAPIELGFAGEAVCEQRHPGIQVAGTEVFWSSTEVTAGPVQGGSPRRLTTSTPWSGDTGSLVVDDDFVYVTDSRSLLRVGRWRSP